MKICYSVTESDFCQGGISMLATFINAGLVLLGSILGLIFKNAISEKLCAALITVLGLCVTTIGITSAIGTQNTLCVILCMAIGTLIGEKINIEQKMDRIGDTLKAKLVRKGEGNSRFTESFVSATVLFCVGAMAINGSLQAGMNGDYSILISKGVIDGITSITFAAAMGIGVMFSIIPLIIYQGALTLLAAWVGPYLGSAVTGEMSAVGGVIIIGIGLNMLNLPKEKLRVGNMLPAIFLPILYVPLSNFITSLF